MAGLAAPSTVTAPSQDPQDPQGEGQGSVGRLHGSPRSVFLALPHHPPPPPPRRFSSLGKDNTNTLKTRWPRSTLGQLRPARTELGSYHRNTSVRCAPKSRGWDWVGKAWADKPWDTGKTSTH